MTCQSRGVFGVPGRVRRGPGTESSVSSGKAREGAPQLVLRNEDIQGHVRRGRRLGGRGRDLCPPLDGRLRCLHPWPEHVRSVRGEWPDDSWKGWWGDNPPYHAPTFVLTHHAREPIIMEGGTTFHFVTDGIHAALERARDAAGARDVKIGGGVSTVRQYLQAGLIDELHFALSPVLLGRGEAMFEGLDLPALGYRVMESTATDLATHVVLGRQENE